jgi:hypothetical protein
MLPAQLGQPLFQVVALAAHLLESGGDDDGRFEFFRGQGLHGRQHGGHRDGDHGQVQVVGQIGHVPDHGQPQDLVGLGVDREDPPGKSGLDHVGHHGVADLPGFLRGPDHGHGLGVEQGVQKDLFAHGVFPPVPGALASRACA